MMPALESPHDGQHSLAAPIDAEDYMQVLLDRQAAWEAEHPRQGWLRPLLKWFIEPGDERWVILPEAEPVKPKRKSTPRVYRSAESIRTEMARIEAEMDRIAGDDCQGRAVVNLSPYSRSRAARNAGRRRFEKLDRDLERYTKLKDRLDRLAGKLAEAEAREAKPPNIDTPTDAGHSWVCLNPACPDNTAWGAAGTCPCGEEYTEIDRDGQAVAP